MARRRIIEVSVKSRCLDSKCSIFIEKKTYRSVTPFRCLLLILMSFTKGYTFLGTGYTAKCCEDAVVHGNRTWRPELFSVIPQLLSNWT